MEKQREQNKDMEAEIAKLQQRLASAVAADGPLRLQLDEAERRHRVSEATHMSRCEIIAVYFGGGAKLASSVQPTATTASSSDPAASAAMMVGTPVQPQPSASASSAAAAAAEKQRNRSDRALLQANTLNMELTEKVADLHEALRGVTAERDKLRERLEIKDNTIRALEAQLVEATYAIQQSASQQQQQHYYHSASSSSSPGRRTGMSNNFQQNNAAASASGGAAAGGVSSNPVSEAQHQHHLLMINDLREQIDAGQATIQELRLQVDHLNIVVNRAKQQQQQQLQQQLNADKNGGTSASRTGGGGGGGGNRGSATGIPGTVTISEEERDEMLSEIDRLRAANNDFRAKVASLEMRCANDASSSSTIAALRQQLATKTRQVVEVQEALAAAQQAQRASGASAPGTIAVGGTSTSDGGSSSSSDSKQKLGGTSSSTSTSGVVFDPHIAHLRSTILQLLVSDRDDVKARLVPVVAALLQMPPCDVNNVYSVHPEWRM